MKVCKVCGEEINFTVRHGLSKTCSDECSKKNETDMSRQWRKIHSPKYVPVKATEKACQECGVLFIGLGLYCKRKVCTRDRKTKVTRSLFKTVRMTSDMVNSLRDAYENFKPVSEQVQDRFKEAQNLHGKESPVERMEAMLAHGKPSTRHKVMPGRKRKS